MINKLLLIIFLTSSLTLSSAAGPVIIGLGSMEGGIGGMVDHFEHLAAIREEAIESGVNSNVLDPLMNSYFNLYSPNPKALAPINGKISAIQPNPTGHLLFSLARVMREYNEVGGELNGLYWQATLYLDYVFALSIPAPWPKWLWNFVESDLEMDLDPEFREGTSFFIDQILPFLLLRDQPSKNPIPVSIKNTIRQTIGISLDKATKGDLLASIRRTGPRPLESSIFAYVTIETLHKGAITNDPVLSKQLKEHPNRNAFDKLASLIDARLKSQKSCESLLTK